MKRRYTTDICTIALIATERGAKELLGWGIPRGLPRSSSKDIVSEMLYDRM